MGKKSGSGIWIRDEKPGSYFRELRNNFLELKILKFFYADPGSGMEKFGSARLPRTCEKVAAARVLLQDIVGREEDPEEEEGHRHRGGHQRTHRLQKGPILSRPLSTQK
jgi:hypothetical protein